MATREVGWVRVTRTNNVGWFWLVLHWQKGQEEPWYLLSDRKGTQALLRLYRIRMWTEEMYGDFKGHGFDLESTHLDDEDRIARLVLGVCLTFVWLITLGSRVVKNGKRHFVDRKDRRDKSYFRIGLDLARPPFTSGRTFPLSLRSLSVIKSDRWLERGLQYVGQEALRYEVQAIFRAERVETATSSPFCRCFRFFAVYQSAVVARRSAERSPVAPYAPTSS